MRVRAVRPVVAGLSRRFSDSKDAIGTSKGVIGAVGSKSSRGTGASIWGRAVLPGDVAALESGKHTGSVADRGLEAGDVIMEILAEDHRRLRAVEFDEELAAADATRDDGGSETYEEKMLAPPRGPRAAHRRYLTHEGVGEGTVYERAAMSQKKRLDEAMESTFVYALPAEAKKAREDSKRSRARRREHDVVESRIEEAMASGAFDDLPGAGKPLPVDENVFEAITGLHPTP